LRKSLPTLHWRSYFPRRPLHCALPSITVWALAPAVSQEESR